MNNLKKLRLLNGFTLDEVAHMTGLNRATISRIENNGSELNESYIKIFTKLYQCSSDYLLGLSKIKNLEQNNTSIPLTNTINFSIDYNDFYIESDNYKESNILNKENKFWFYDKKTTDTINKIMPFHYDKILFLIDSNIKLDSISNGKLIIAVIKESKFSITPDIFVLRRLKEFNGNEIFLLERVDRSELMKIDPNKNITNNYLILGAVLNIEFS